MGAILTQPLTNKFYQRFGHADYRVGISDMQGYRINMEDAHCVSLSLNQQFPQISLFSVFDGHAGDRAAIYMSKNLPTKIASLKDPRDHKQLSDAIVSLDQEFLKNLEERSHGCTCLFGTIEPTEFKGAAKDQQDTKTPASSSSSSSSSSSTDQKEPESKSPNQVPSSTPNKPKKAWKVLVGNLGDSRAVLVRADGRCVSMTEDHKPNSPEEAARIRAAGGFVSQNRVDGQLAMSRAIGDFTYKGDTALAADKQKVIAVPDITTEIAYEGDVLLMCCDGIVEQMSNEDAAEFLHKEMQQAGGITDPAEVAGRLMDYALDKGSKDNMTAMVITFGNGDVKYTAPDEYKPGPYYDNNEFVDAFRTDCKKHGLEGAKYEEFVKAAKALPKPRNMAGGGMGGMGGMGAPMVVAEDQDGQEKPIPLNRNNLMQLMQILAAQHGGDLDDEDEDMAPLTDAAEPPAAQGAKKKKKNKKKGKKKTNEGKL